MTLDDDARSTLAALLRARPATADELAGVAALPTARFAAALEHLERGGYLERTDDGVRVAAPDAAVAARLRDLAAEDRRLADDLAALVDQLPGWAREWDHAASGTTTPLPVEAVHGTRNQWELWMRLMAEAPPRNPLATFPDFPGLAGFVLDNAEMLQDAAESFGFRIRTLVRAEELRDAGVREQVAGYARLGLELRTLPTLPGWFYADAGVMAALPLSWGEAVPTSVAVVREPSLVAPLAAFAERLWTRSRPLPEQGRGWDAVLDLLAQDLSDEEVAAALRQSVRTVRRRIAEAAEAYGVTTRFELGREWARRR